MQTKEFKIRLPEDLKAWLENRSIRNFRSMNKELVALLSAIRDGEENGANFEKLANPSGISGDTPLFPT
ncbi:Arc family DNA-binding protein [Shinella zoogloeoides]|uniref:Arc family DNA-binding protein n=1 Tax=Shinella zoogloeoides TaxID=352475 RepID=UPI000E6470D0|nr:Arc family DNA-binding protein [Shinella zoogloeoides]